MCMCACAPCRRQGEVTGLLLSCLADDSWRQLDLAGCSKLYATELLAAAARMPHLTALDVSGGQVCFCTARQLASRIELQAQSQAAQG